MSLVLNQLLLKYSCQIILSNDVSTNQDIWASINNIVENKKEK